MKFNLVDLLRLTLNKDPVPLYSCLQDTTFPQKIPYILVSLCFLNSVLKLSVPLILQETYAMMGKQLDSTNYIVLISLVIFLIGLSQVVLIAYGLMLNLYRLNVKRELSSRIISNNFKNYRFLLESIDINDKAKNFNMELWVKISTKLSVYLHNYYESYLSLIFQCFNIIVILIYLFYKLSFSLFFGLAIAGMVMYKTIKTANQMTNIRFENINLRARRLKILEDFFTRVTQYKMCWLDNWIYSRVTEIQHSFQNGLRKIKLLDCWCVALWQFTGVGISSIVIIAYFLLGFNEKVDQSSVFTPSTFIYLLSMLNFPLNALSWYIAGIRTAERAISQIKEDVKLSEREQISYTAIEANEKSIIIKDKIVLKVQNTSITIPVRQLGRNKIYSISGHYEEYLLQKLIFLFNKNTSKGYVQQNAWLAPSPLETILMYQKLTALSDQQLGTIQQLMELFECNDIPLTTNTQNYSGGEKLRISLVRAFYLGEIIVINSNLNSLDPKMKSKIQNSILNLIHRVSSTHSGYTIFIRQNQQIADEIITFQQIKNLDYCLCFKQNRSAISAISSLSIISPEIQKFIQTSLTEQKKIQKQKQYKKAKQQLKQIKDKNNDDQKSLVSLDTFKIYYKSPKHIVFAISMLVVTLLSNYYNYYVNSYINLANYDENQVIIIIFITTIFAIGLFFRSYYFADANLDESSRICHNLNKNILMQQLTFYQSEHKVRQDEQQSNSKSKLICALTSDTQTIADHFPFTTNIFANNITVILSSIIVILIQVPQIFILLIFLVTYANNLNKISHKKDEAIKIALKQKQAEVYKIISDIQAGRKYAVIHEKVELFTKAYIQQREQYMQIEWLNQKYKNYINLKYKGVMILFLIIGVAAYSFFNILTSESGHDGSNKSSGLALLIQYTIQLSNYLLYFTMSIWEIKGQAVSIQRVKPFLDEKPTISKRINDSQSVISKIKKSNSQNKVNLKNDNLIKIEKLDFAYESNPQTKIFENLSFEINEGDAIIIRGRSGSGKTTLYKLLTSAYPHILYFINQPFNIAFSPQHPLLLPDTSTIQQNINPYKVSYNPSRVEQIKKKHGLEESNRLQDLSYQQKIIINNLRAYICGAKGITIYDEPLQICNEGGETYLIVTHHHNFKHNSSFQLLQGKLVKKQ